jgi:hypothetical protein
MMTPEARKVVRDAKRGLKRCQRMNAELNDRIARLRQIDLAAQSADNADQLHWLLRAMQAAEAVDLHSQVSEAA